MLKNPDRLVLDFSNAVLETSVRNIAVHTKDVLEVRVGRFQSEPPVIRVVIDLSGPRAFDVVSSDQQVLVRVKSRDAGVSSAPLKVAPSPVLASAVAPDLAGRTNSGSDSPSIRAAVAKASIPLPAVSSPGAMPGATPGGNSTSPLRDLKTSGSKVPATDTTNSGPKAQAVTTADKAPTTGAASVAAFPAAKLSPKVVQPAVEAARPPLPVLEQTAAIAVAKAPASTPPPSPVQETSAQNRAPLRPRLPGPKRRPLLRLT